MRSVKHRSKKSKKTYLDITYYNYIENIINTTNIDETRLEIYDLIIEDLMIQNRGELVAEFKYRFTDGEDPNEIILSLLERDDTLDGLIWCLKKRLEEFIEEDLYKRFLL